MTQLNSRFLVRVVIQLHPTLQLGVTPAGERRVFLVSGGSFEGPRLKGEILPVGGSDLLLVRGDGSAQQDVRMLLRTADEALILMTYRGVRHASAAVTARIAAGEKVGGDEYYLRTVPFFETSFEQYSWLNKIVSVGVGVRQGDAVVYDIFEIL
jgi:hypothetical protein